MAIETKIEWKKLMITCDLEEPTPSASVKTLLVTITRGNMKTSLTIGGKPLTIGLNAYIPKWSYVGLKHPKSVKCVII